jgi:hypothetical protein
MAPLAQSQGHSQGSSEPDTFEFYEFLERSELQSQIGPKELFFCSTAIKRYLGEQDCWRLRALLDDLYPSHDNTHVVKVILNDYTDTLCILMKISKGKKIKRCIEVADLDDAHLPFDALTMRASFPAKSDAEFCESFCEAQWAFRPLSFKKNMVKDLKNPRYILPITLMEETARGGSASVSKIEIHGCYNLLHEEKPPGSSPCTSVNRHRSHRPFSNVNTMAG